MILKIKEWLIRSWDLRGIWIVGKWILIGFLLAQELPGIFLLESNLIY